MAGTARRLARRYLHLLPRRLRPQPKPPAKARKRRQRTAPAAPPAAPPREALLRSLEIGRDVDHAIVAQARTLIIANQHDAAISVAEGLLRRADTAELGHLVRGIVAYKQGYDELALAELRRTQRATWTTYAAIEYVRAGLHADPQAALEEIRALAAQDPDGISAKTWFHILAPVFGYGDQALAREVFTVFERHVRDDPRTWRAGELQVGWMRPWVEADSESPTAPAPPDGRPSFAIVDYGHPGANRASANIGDHIQTIAALGHLVRHQNVRLHGPEELTDLLDDLKQRTRLELRKTDIDADLQVMTVHRDASMYEEIPERTWVLCFGWYMHALFKMRHGFPLHRNLRPIFISFHCNKRELLTQEAIEYLKRYAPVGCRDWTTVYLLKSIGVPAFFSGCVTTTINTVFPDLEAEPPADAPIGYVDVKDPPPGAITYRHSEGIVRKRPFVANVRHALDLLETYRTRHRKLRTSRLHCYLPVRSIGMDVDFDPRNPSDVRFDGLLDIDDRAFNTIRTGIRDKLEQVFAAILSGRSEDEVYALWREITADDVAAAEERRRREHKPVPAPDLSQRLQLAQAQTIVTPATEAPSGDPIHCAVIVTKGMERPELEPAVLVASLLEHASRPLHVHVIGSRGGGRPIEQRIARRFPQVTFSWVPTRPLARTDQTRLLLPRLLPDVERVVLLPVPAVATADVAELADLDLGPDAIAAPTRAGKDASGFGFVHRAALRLGNRIDLAAELRRTAHARHAFDFDAFATDVMVLDLQRLRREDFTEHALSLVTEFCLTELEVLQYLFGPGRAEIPERWATVPTRTPERGPGLIHWADRVKPWQPQLTPERDRWRAYASRYRSRTPQQVAAP
jgi:hypothetical protein